MPPTPKPPASTAPPLSRTTLTPTPPAGQFATPDITVAQIAAAVTLIVSQAVAWGWIGDGTGQKLVAIGGIVLAAVWPIADSIIRHGRSTGNASRTR